MSMWYIYIFVTIIEFVTPKAPFNWSLKRAMGILLLWEFGFSVIVIDYSFILS